MQRRLLIIAALVAAWLAPAIASGQEAGAPPPERLPEALAQEIAEELAGEPAAPEEPAPVIELVTMGPGKLIWEKWGHSALCVRYPDPRRDLCYNYGTTDFSDPVTLVWDFLRNRSLFWVSASHPARMVRFYRDVLDRSLWVQRLPLSPDKAREAAALLAAAAAGEDKYYRYHHYDDNCSTRVRDIIDRVTGGALAQATEPYTYTFREITRRGMSEYPFLVLLSDFPMGRRADRLPNLYQAMHLPLVLRDQVTERLGVEPKLVYERQGRDFDVSNPISRWWLVVFAVVMGVPALLAWRLGRFERLGLAIAVLPAGIMGVVLWTMAIISSLPEIRWNEALLALWPVDLALPLLPVGLRRHYGRARVTWLAAVLLLSLGGVLHQPLWGVVAVALVPCLVAAMHRRRARAIAAPADAQPRGSGQRSGKRSGKASVKSSVKSSVGSPGEGPASATAAGASGDALRPATRARQSSRRKRQGGKGRRRR